MENLTYLKKIITYSFLLGWGAFSTLKADLLKRLDYHPSSSAFLYSESEKISDEPSALRYLQKLMPTSQLFRHVKMDLKINSTVDEITRKHFTAGVMLLDLPVFNSSFSLHTIAEESVLLNGVTLDTSQFTSELPEHLEKLLSTKISSEIYINWLNSQLKTYHLKSDQLQLGWYIDNKDIKLVYLLEDSSLKNFESSLPQGPYRVWLDANNLKILNMEALFGFFSVAKSQAADKVNTITGIGSVYPINRIISPALEEVDLFNLLGNQLLQGKYVYVYSSGAYKNMTLKADSNLHDFRYEPDHYGFDNVSAYYYGNKVVQWFVDKGVPLDTVLSYHTHCLDEHNAPLNNAYYDPLDKSIHIGDSDGTFLQYIGSDLDVYSHETAHHFIYYYGGLRSLNAESGAIHEGIADYVAYAIAGDPDLAESVFALGAYLRTAENEKHFPEDMSMDIHGGGDILAGALWDIRVSLNSSADQDDFDRLVVRSLPFMNTEAVFLDLFNGLLLLDRYEFTGKFKCKLIESFTSRGFHFTTPKINSDDCTLVSSIQNTNNKSVYPDIVESSQETWNEPVPVSDESSSANVIQEPIGYHLFNGCSLGGNLPKNFNVLFCLCSFLTWLVVKKR